MNEITCIGKDLFQNTKEREYNMKVPGGYRCDYKHYLSEQRSSRIVHKLSGLATPKTRNKLSKCRGKVRL